MPQHVEHDLSFETPEGWEDRSIVAYRAPDEPAGAPNMMVTREPMREATLLKTHAERRMVEMARSLPGFELLESGETELGGLRAVFVRYEWTSDAGPLEQSLTFVLHPSTPRSAFVFTTTTPRARAPEARAMFHRILSSVSFEAPASVRRKVLESTPPPPMVHIPMPGFPGLRR